MVSGLTHIFNLPSILGMVGSIVQHALGCDCPCWPKPGWCSGRRRQHELLTTNWKSWEFPTSYGDWSCQNGRHWNGGSIGMLFQLQAHWSNRCKKNMSILAARRCAWPSSLGEGAFLAHLIRDAVQIWYGFEEASTVSIDLGSKSYLLNYPDHMGIIVANT